MAKIIAICNQKGGVGKTTTAINIAAYLAISSKRTLLIDTDPQGNATSGLGVNKNGVKTSIYDILVEEADPRSAIVKTAIDGLSLIPSNLSLTGAEVELVSVMRREYRLKKALEGIRQDYDYIIIDCPPSLGLITINALTAAGSVLIPIQCEYYALEGLGQLVSTIDLVRKNINPDLVVEGVLLTMADFRTNLTTEVINEARTYFKEKVYNTVIPRNIRITESPGFGKPIALYDKASIGAIKYRDLTNELLGVKKEISTQNIETIVHNTLADNNLTEVKGG
ncbi:MAG: AAA family ATPase [Candidatus Omnitrophota bacterium]